MIYAKRPRRRARPHVFRFMGGKLVCDNYAGYKALFDHGVIEAGCLAHARHKLHDLYANHRSAIAEEGLRYFAALIEREAREQRLDADGRRQLRQQRSKPIAEALRQWLTRQCGQVPDGSATAKASHGVHDGLESALTFSEYAPEII